MSTTLIDRTLPAARLSQLIIDADKDWLKYNITNFGAGGIDLYSTVTAHASRHASGGADPIPAGGIARSQLELPTTKVSYTYLKFMDKMGGANMALDGGVPAFVTLDTYADKASACYVWPGGGCEVLARYVDEKNWYRSQLTPAPSAADHSIVKDVAGTLTTLATEAVDIDSGLEVLWLQASGSTITSKRWRSATPLNVLALPATPTGSISATDTSFASGCFGMRYDQNRCPILGYLMDPASPGPKAIAFYEVPIIGSGTDLDPFRAQLPELVEVPTSAELDAYPPVLKSAIRANAGGKVNRLALSHSALIPTDPTTGKPLYSTCIVRVFEQPDRQPHLLPIREALARLETQTAIPVRKLDVDQAIRRAKEMDPKLSNFDFYAMPSPSDDEIRKYIEWRKATFGVDTRWEDARHYLESEKGWA